MPYPAGHRGCTHEIHGTRNSVKSIDHTLQSLSLLEEPHAGLPKARAVTVFFGCWGIFIDLVSKVKLRALKLKQKEKRSIHWHLVYLVNTQDSFRKGYFLNQGMWVDSDVMEGETCFLVTAGI